MAEPATPSNLAAVAVSGETIHLTWQRNSTNELGFYIEMSTDGVNYSPIGDTPTGVLEFYAGGLDEVTQYWFHVSAWNNQGNSDWSDPADTTTLLNAPTELTATVVSDTEIDLAWVNNSTNQDGFEIYQSTDGTNYTLVDTTTGTTYSLTGLTARTWYRFRVRAYSATDYSTYAEISRKTATTKIIDMARKAAQFSQTTAWNGTDAELNSSDSKLYASRFNVTSEFFRLNQDLSIAASVTWAHDIGNFILDTVNDFGYGVTATKLVKFQISTLTILSASADIFTSRPLGLTADFGNGLAYVHDADNLYELNLTTLTIARTLAKGTGREYLTREGGCVLDGAGYLYIPVFAGDPDFDFYLRRVNITAWTFDELQLGDGYHFENTRPYVCLGDISNGFIYVTWAVNNGLELNAINPVFKVEISTFTVDDTLVVPQMIDGVKVGGFQSGAIDVAHGYLLLGEWSGFSAGSNEIEGLCRIDLSTFTASVSELPFDFIDVRQCVIDATAQTAWLLGNNNTTGTLEGRWISLDYTPLAAPAVSLAPVGLTLTVISKNQIDLAWTRVFSTETEFCIERSTNGTDYSEIGRVSGVYLAYQSTGLDPDTHYWYRVRASNTGGYSDYSNTPDATTLKEIPTAPTDLLFGPAWGTKVDLTWTNTPSNEEGYKIEQSNGGGAFFQVAIVGVGVESHTVTGLDRGSTYYFCVCAYNNGGNSAYAESAEYNTLGDPLERPTLTLQYVGGTTTKLSWVYNTPGGGEWGIKIEQSTNGTDYTLVWTSPDEFVLEYLVPNLTPETQYWFRSYSFNGEGDSVASNVVTDTTAIAQVAVARELGLTAFPSRKYCAIDKTNNILFLYNNSGGDSIRKYSTADFTEIASADLGAFVDFDLDETSDIGWAFMGDWSIVKWQPSDLTVLDSYPAVVGSGVGCAIDWTNSRMYVGGSINGVGAKFYQVDLTDGSLYDEMTSGNTADAVTSHPVFGGDGHLYMVSYWMDGSDKKTTVFKIIENNIDLTNRLDLGIIGEPRHIVADTVNAKVYVLTSVADDGFSRIVKIRLDTFEVESTLTFDSVTNVGDFYTGFIDQTRGYLYAATNIGSDIIPEKVVRVELATFTVSHTLVMPLDYTYFVTSNHDDADGFGYFIGMDWEDSNKGRFIKLNNLTYLPTDPINLTATTASAHQIDLAWTRTSTNEDGFKVEISLDGVEWGLYGNVGAGVQTLNVTGLTPNVQYYFRVKAYNIYGDSGASNTDDDTTTAAAIGAVTDYIYVWEVVNLDPVFECRVRKINKWTMVSVAESDDLGDGLTIESIAVDATSVWVSRSDGNVVRLNRDTLATTATISVGGTARNTLAVDDTYVWCLVYDTGNLQKINKSTEIIDATITVAVGNYGVCVDPTYVWVACGDEKEDVTTTLRRIERTTGTVTSYEVGPISEAGDPAWKMLGIRSDGFYVWFGCGIFNMGYAGQFDISAETMVNFYWYSDTIPSLPYDLHLDASYVWVSHNDAESAVAKFNKSDGSLIGNISVPSQTSGVGVSGDSVYTYAVFNQGDVSGSVVKISSANSVLASLALLTPVCVGDFAGGSYDYHFAPVPPSAPTNFLFTVMSQTEIDLTWELGSANTDGFKIEQSEDGVTYTEIADLLPTELTFNVTTGLVAGTLYYFRICAYNVNGNSPYAELTATTASAKILQMVRLDESYVPGYPAESDVRYDATNNKVFFSKYSFGWKIVRTDADLAIEAESDFGLSLKHFIIDHVNDVGYACDHTTSLRLLKFQLSTLTQISASGTLFTYQPDGITGDLANGKAYAADSNNLYEIDLATLTVLRTLPYGGKYYVGAARCVLDGAGYLYILVRPPSNETIWIRKVDLAAWTYVEFQLPGTNASMPYSIEIDVPNGFIYATCTVYPTPHQLWKIEISSFTVVDTLELPVSEGGFSFGLPTCTAIDATHGVLLVGCEYVETNPSSVCRVDLATFTASLIGIPYDFTRMRACDIDTANQVAWFFGANIDGGAENLGRWLKIDYTPAGAPPLAPYELYARTVRQETLTLYWSCDATDETGFKVEQSLDGVDYTQIGTTGEDEHTFDVTGLTVGTKYWFRVCSYNGYGDSAYADFIVWTATDKMLVLVDQNGDWSPGIDYHNRAIFNSTDGKIYSNYFGTTPTNMFKLNPDFSVALSNSLGQVVSSFAIDEENDLGYAVSSGKIVKFQLSTLTTIIVSGVIMTSGYWIILDLPNTKAYVFDVSTTLREVDLTTLTVTRTLTPAAGWSYQNRGKIVLDGAGYAYIGVRQHAGNGFYLRKIDLTAWTYVDLSLGVAFEQPYSIEIDTDNGYIYLTENFYSSDTLLWKIEISSFTVIDTLPIPSTLGEMETEGILNSAIDLVHGKLLLTGTQDGDLLNATGVVSVDLATFTYTAIPVPYDYTWLNSCAIDPATQVLWVFGMDTQNSSARWAKISYSPGGVTPPADPTNLVATTVSKNEIGLTWDRNSTDEDGFKIERSINGTDFSQIDTVGAGVLTYQSVGLDPDTQYWYRVRAYNSGGDSGYSNVDDATTLKEIPADPTLLISTLITQTEIDLSWTINSTNEDGFKIERSANGVDFSQIDTVGAGENTYQNTGLTQNTNYWYRVRAYNNGGNSGYTNILDVITLKDIPEAPTLLQASVVSQTEIGLSWTINSTSEDGFKIEQSLNGVDFSQIDTVGTGVSTYDVEGLTQNTHYWYRVRAYNNGGNSDYTNTADATTLKDIPTAPTELISTLITQTEIDLSWTINSSNEDGFKIERSLNGTDYTQIDTVGAGENTYQNTGLTQNTNYWYRVRAYNNGGNSAYTNVLDVITLKDAPTAPTDLVATTISRTQIALTWTDTSGNEDGFKIEQSINGTDFSQIDVVGEEIEEYQVEGLTADTHYWFRVRAYNNGGNSDYSNIDDATTFKDTPSAPTDLEATAISQTRIDLTWVDTSGGEDGFKIERSANGVDFVQIDTVAADVEAYSSTGLTQDTQYWYRVRAYNNGGDSAYSNVDDATTLKDIPAPPIDLGATPVSQTQIDLAWTDMSTNEDGFKIEQSVNGTDFVEIDTVGAGIEVYSATSLTANTQYWYRVRAYNNGGNSDYTNTATATTLKTPPSAPTDLTATPFSKNQIDLEWTDTASNEEGYKIERSTNGVDFTQIDLVDADIEAYSATGLTANTQYWFRVRAYNNGGNSDYSNTANATTLKEVPSAPTDLTATTFSKNRIDLAWTDTSSNEDGFKIERSLNGVDFTQIGTVGEGEEAYSAVGLDPDTQYWFRVCAYNNGGNSDYSNTANATTLKEPPSAPTDLSATTISQTEIDLAWTDTSSNEEGFKIEQSLNGTDFVQIDTVGAGVEVYSVTGLTQNTSYWYRVRAYNNGGDSSYSNTANAVTLKDIPSAPTDLTATTVSQTEIDLAWTDTASNEDGYKIEQSINGTDFVQIDTVSADVEDYNVTGLTANTQYWYRVRAYNNGGNSDYSNTDTATTLKNPPSAPTDLTATTISQTAIDLAWLDTASNEEGFKIEQSINGTDFVQIDTVSADVLEYHVTGLTQNTHYWYRVRAYNNGGDSDYSNTADATTLKTPPSAPTDLDATAISQTQIDLAWTDTASNEDGYKIEQSINGTDFVQIDTVAADVEEYSVTGLTQDTQYWYRVRAYNNGGNSDYSNTATATTLKTPPSAPINLQSSVESQTQINLTWQEISGNEEGIKIERSINGTDFTEIASIGAGVLYYESTGLTQNTHYWYRVRAYNNGGNSDYSNLTDATTLKNIPAAPTDLTATTVSQTQIDLAWTDNADNEEGYKIERSANGIDFVQIDTVAADVEAYSATGLTQNTQYWFRVRAYNNGGDSAYTNIADATTLKTIPVAPTELLASTMGISQIDLIWSDNSDNEEGFKIERSANGVDFTQIAVNPPDVRTYSDTGLSHHTQYWYRVRAYNNGGDSAYTNIADATTLADIPTDPTDLQATVISQTQVDLSWTDTSSNEDGFQIEQSLNGTDYTLIHTTAADVEAYSVTGLTAETHYWFRVRAFNGEGYSSYAGPVEATTPMELPADPTDLTIDAVYQTRIDFSWTDNATNEAGYKVEMSTNGVDFTQIDILGQSVESYIKTDLTPETQYWFRVRAYNAGGNLGYTNVGTATTLELVPADPTDLVATAINPNRIDLAWVDNSDNEDGFKIEMSTNGIDFTEIDQTAAEIEAYSATGLTPETQYWFRVRAFNTGGNSNYTNIATATTPMVVPSDPTDLVATTVSHVRIDLAWVDTSTNEAGFKIEQSANGVDFTEIAIVGAGVQAHIVVGLTPTTQYWFRVRAYNAGGNSGYSNIDDATTLHPSFVIPEAPDHLVALAVSPYQIDLTWRDNSTREEGYNVEKSTDGVNFTLIGILAASTTGCSVYGLQPATTYYFRINAFNHGGESGYTNVSHDKTKTRPLGTIDTISSVSNQLVAYAYDDASLEESRTAQTTEAPPIIGSGDPSIIEPGQEGSESDVNQAVGGKPTDPTIIVRGWDVTIQS